MAHDTHHDTHETESTKTTTSFRSAFWFVTILAGLFIAAVNFVNIMGHDEENGHHGTEHATEEVKPSLQPGLEQTTEHAAESMDSAHAEVH